MNEHLKRIQTDVDLMNKTFSGKPVATEPPAPGTDPPSEFKTDAPKTDPPATESPAEFKTGVPSTDAPKTEAPTTNAPDDRDQIIEDLRAKLADNDKASKTQAPTTEAPLVFEDQDFIGDLDVEDVTKDSKELNKLLNTVYQKGITDTRGMVGTQISQSIPSMITMVSNLQKATENFYEDNKDLEPFKKVVATVFDDLVAENPNKSYSDLMADVAPEARKRLELPMPQKKVVDKGKPPKLPRKKGKPGRTDEKPPLDPMQKDIDEMNENLRR